MPEPDVPPTSAVPIEQLAADLRRLYLRLGGDRTDTTTATWTRRSPEEWERNLAAFDQALVGACRAVGVEAPDPVPGELLPGPDRAALIEALAAAGMDVRLG